MPLFGSTVADLRARAEALGLDPDAGETRLALELEVPRGAWEAVVTFEVHDGEAVATGVEVSSTVGQRLTRAVWQRVRLAEVIGEAAAMADWMRPSRPHQAPLPAAKKPRDPGLRGPGRPREYDDAHYQRVAAIYMKAKEHGHRAPVRAVARALVKDFPGLTDRTDARARTWVRTARVRGFINDAKADRGDRQ